MEQNDTERLKQKLALLGEPALPASLSAEALFRRMDEGRLTLPDREPEPEEETPGEAGEAFGEDGEALAGEAGEGSPEEGGDPDGGEAPEDGEAPKEDPERKAEGEEKADPAAPAETGEEE